MNKNELFAMLRRTQEASDSAKAVASQAVAQISALEASIASLQRAFSGGAMKPLTNRERALAACRDMRPNWLIMPYSATEGVTAEDEVVKQTDTVGRFIIDRIRATWQNDSGYYGLISSAQGNILDHTATVIVDFTWTPVDGRNNQHLSNEPIPGDVLARGDGDGFPAGGLVLEPGSDFKIVINPLRAWPSDGTLTFICEGIQCYDQKGAP